MMLKLKKLIEQSKKTQAELARQLKISEAAMAQIINHNQWPKTNTIAHWQNEITKILRVWGMPQSKIDIAFDVESESNADNQPTDQPIQNVPESERIMIRKQNLSSTARKHFGVFADPFNAPMQDVSEVFLSTNFKYVSETMRHVTMQQGNILAVVGESGAGKTTLRRQYIDKMHQESDKVIIIEPFVLAMEADDKKGKTLKIMQIAEAAIRAINPTEKLRGSQDARFDQLQRALIASSRAGNKHVLIIEEAHCLPIATLKHLKRVIEMTDGVKPLISIILIGQTELRDRLSETNAEVREVVGRTDIVELPALNNDLEAYVAHKLTIAKKSLGDVFENGALDALRRRLLIEMTMRGAANATKRTVSLAHPLMVGNAIITAMNLAADLGVPKINADIIAKI